MKTICRNSRDNIIAIFLADAPITFRMPISFLLLWAVNAVRPMRPRQEITTVMPAKYQD